MAPSTTEIAGDKAHEQSENSRCQHSHDDCLDSVLSVYRISCYLWSTDSIIALVLHDARFLSITHVEFVAVALLRLDVGFLASSGLARRTRRVLTRGNLRVEVRFVGPSGRAVRTTFAGDLVPSTVWILECNTIAGEKWSGKVIKIEAPWNMSGLVGWVIEWAVDLPATVYFLAVTSVQGNGQYLAVGDNNQFAIIVITVLGLIWRERRKNVSGDKSNTSDGETFKSSFTSNWIQQGENAVLSSRSFVDVVVIPAKSFCSSWDFSLHLIRKRLKEGKEEERPIIHLRGLVLPNHYFSQDPKQKKIFSCSYPSPPFIYHNFYLRKLAIVVFINLINSLIDFRLTFLCFRAQKANKFPRDFALRCVFFITKQSLGENGNQWNKRQWLAHEKAKIKCETEIPFLVKSLPGGKLCKIIRFQVNIFISNSSCLHTLWGSKLFHNFNQKVSSSKQFEKYVLTSKYSLAFDIMRKKFPTSLVTASTMLE